MKLNERHMLFIGEVVAACAEHGITLTMSATEKVVSPDESEELGCSGFFRASDRLLSVAVAKPVFEWLPVLIHEFGHMEQWIEDPDQCEQEDSLVDRLWEWLDGDRELDAEEVTALTRLAMSYELDCERRTAWRLHEDPGFEISYSSYIKNANAYLYLYPMMARHRKWCSQNPPYRVQELVAIMPDKFIGETDDYWNVPEEAQRLIIDRCFPKETP